MSKQFVSISTKLIFLVLSIAIVSIIITSALSFTLAESIIKDDVEGALKTESDRRGSSISSIIEHRLEKLVELSNNQAVQKTLSELTISLDEVTLNNLLLEKSPLLENEIHLFQQNQLEAGLRTLTIINSPGRVIFSLDDAEQLGSIATGFTKVNKPTIDFIQDQEKSRLMKVAVPIKSGSAQFGTMTTTMSSSVFDDVLLNRYGLEKTGEVYLVNKNGIMISESLFFENAPFNQQVNTLPVTQCFEEGKNVDGTAYLDYRGVEIYGVSHCRADLGFVLLTEVDESVILDPIYDLQNKIIIIGGAIIAVASAITFILSKRISRPILKLKLAAEKISSGNFDVETKIQTNDEIGQLSESFDTMTKTIKETVSAITKREDIIRRQEDLLLQFSKEQKDCCVCLVDIVGSLKIAQSMSEEQSKKYYKIFTDSVLDIVKEYGGTPVKFINDAILFYFSPAPDQSVNTRKLDCCLKIAESNKEINDKMLSEDLPGIGYRISSTFGDLHTVYNDDGSIQDIFGEPVSLCFRINQYALPNTVIIAKSMYEKSENLDFKFTKLENSIIQELKFDLYIVSRK